MQVLEPPVAYFDFNEQGQNHELKYYDTNRTLYLRKILALRHHKLPSTFPVGLNINIYIKVEDRYFPWNPLF